jgi:hypothetical protein
MLTFSEPMPLTRHDYTLLLDAFSQSPLFASLRSRQILLRNALGVYPNLAPHLPQLDLEGAPNLAADTVIRHFDGLQAAPNLPALSLLIHAVEPFAGPFLNRLENLRQRLGWTDTAAILPASVWQDPRPATDILHERIIGEDTLRPLFYLRRALRAADAVVRIDLDHNAIGSGFLIAPGLVMTNHHVIGSAGQARRAQAVFFDELPDTEAPPSEPPRSAVSAPGESLLCTDPALDFTLLRFASTPALARYLPLSTGIPTRNQRVAIIQHAGAAPKRISLQNNLVAHADHRVVQYYTSTLRGSSGSPVLDDAFAVVALHHGAVLLDAPDPHAKSPEAVFYRNQGTTMRAIIDHLRSQHPALLDEITIRED